MTKKISNWMIVLTLFMAVSACEESEDNEIKGDGTETGSVTDGYVLYTFKDDYYTTHLIDTAGNDVKTWTSAYTAAGAAYLSNQLTLLRAGNTTAANSGTFSTGGAASGIIEEIDDDGNVLWSFQRDVDSCTLHHDFKEIDDNTIIATAWELIEYNGENYWNDHVLIIDKTTNTVTWDWSAFSDGGILPDENNDSDTNPGDSTGFNPGDSTDFNPGDSTGNSPGNNTGSSINGTADYLHINSVLYKDGSILISSRQQSTVYLVDKESKEITATFTADSTLSHQHDATFLDNGNILIFNNDAGENESAIVEINASDEVVWEYANNIYSSLMSGAQRLESGNTLICLSKSGRFLEVTSDGEVVWDFSPDYTDSTKKQDIFKVRKYTEY